MGSIAAPPVLRLAILECDEPVGRTKETYGGYGGLFAALLRHGVAQYPSVYNGDAAPELRTSKFDVVHGHAYPDLDDVDAVLLTGSKFNSFDDDAWILRLVDFTRTVLAQQRVRLIGVCFGHQIIGRALHVGVGRSDAGWEVAVVPVALTDEGKQLFGVQTLNIHQMHRDIVYELPPGVQPLGHTDRCAIQGMYAPRRLLAVQGHPEFDGDIVAELLQRRHEQGIFDRPTFDEAMGRVRHAHDGTRVASAFLRFLVEG